MSQDKTYVDLPREENLPDFRGIVTGGKKKMSRKEAEDYRKYVDPDLGIVKSNRSEMEGTPKQQFELPSLPGDDQMPYEREANRKVVENLEDLGDVAMDVWDATDLAHLPASAAKGVAAGAMKAIIPMMSRKTQDRFIEDYARKVASKFANEQPVIADMGGKKIVNFYGRSMSTDDLTNLMASSMESKVKALPEKQQDAFVSTLMTIDPEKFKFGGPQSVAKGDFSQGHNPFEIHISRNDASTPYDFATTWMHEVSHPMDAQFDPIYAYQRYVTGELPENIKTSRRSVREGIGDEMENEKVYKDAMKDFNHPSNIAFSEGEYDKTLDAGMPEETLNMFLDDLSMVPIPGTGKQWKSPGKKVWIHHEDDYPYGMQQVNEYELKQSGLDPNSLPLKTRKNSARSLEDWANYTPAMSSKDAQKATRAFFPKTSSKIDAILEKDPRRPFADKFVPQEYWAPESERELLPEIDWAIYK